MRKLWINALAPALLLAAATTADAQPKPDPKPEPNPAKDKEAPAKSKLEQMLEIALKNNPDLRVADAKAREADAEVSRTRLAVTQKVVLLYNNIEAARANVQLAEKQFARLRDLAAQKVVDHTTLDEAEAKLRQAKADLAKLEAEVPYLLGQPNAKVRGDGKDWELWLGKAEPGGDHRAAVESALRYLQGTTAQPDSATALAVLAMQQALAPPVSAPMSEKLREKLEAPVNFKHDGPLTPKDALEMLADRYGLPIVVKAPDARFAEGDLPVSLKDVPLGAVLQWVEDSLPKHCFVVREYGLVFMQRDKVPPGALLLRDFWKAKDKETTKPKDEKK